MTFDEATAWLKSIGARIAITSVSGSYEIVTITAPSAAEGALMCAAEALRSALA